MKSDLPYIQHIIDSIAAIESYTTRGRDHFMSERLVQDAVIRNFEIIGEAATRLSIATRGPAGALWTKVIAFRNRLIHGYWSVDLVLVWDVIAADLPLLKDEANRLFAELSRQGPSTPT